MDILSLFIIIICANTVYTLWPETCLLEKLYLYYKDLCIEDLFVDPTLLSLCLVTTSVYITRKCQEPESRAKSHTKLCFRLVSCYVVLPDITYQVRRCLLLIRGLWINFHLLINNSVYNSVNNINNNVF